MDESAVSLSVKGTKEWIIIALLTINDLTVAFGDQEIISDLSFVLNEGDFLIVVGENGVGKTTLVNALLNRIKPRSGDISMANHLRIGYVPQFRNVDIDYPLSVRNFVSLNLLHNWRPWLSRKERAQVKRVLKQADLEKIADRPLGLASGGEKQRAYLAQALLSRPQLLILDESTASLDNEMKFELLDLVSRFQQNGLTVIFITHDMDLAQRYGTRYLMMKKDGYESGPINELDILKGGQSNV